MATSKIEVWVLQCDQGMGTLLKVYDSAGKLDKLVLIDLGCELGNERYAKDAIDKVNDALTEMSAAGKTPGIWQLIVSHQDYDHWSLLKSLFLPGGKKRAITLDRVLYGGTNWRDPATDVLTEIATQYGCNPPVALAGAQYSAYSTPGTIVDLLTIDGVQVRTLAVNTPSRRADIGLKRNGSSAVMAIHFAGKVCLIPGDATSETLGYINEIIAAWTTSGRANPVIPCHLLTAPHHGSLKTIAGNFNSKNPNLDIARSFAANAAAWCVAASAGYTNDFLHPFKVVIDILAVSAGSTSTAHSYVVWNESTGNWNEITGTAKNVYTTITTLGTPPGRISWFFTLNATGAAHATRLFTPAPSARRTSTTLGALPASLRRTHAPATHR